jgi:hypothetical protein
VVWYQIIKPDFGDLYFATNYCLKMTDFRQINRKFLLEFIQGVSERCGEILTTSYWLHVELGKNIKKILCQKIK